MHRTRTYRQRTYRVHASRYRVTLDGRLSCAISQFVPREQKCIGWRTERIKADQPNTIVLLRDIHVEVICQCVRAELRRLAAATLATHIDPG